ncbi:MAG: hypothetical protein NC341_05585 [Blautia sp.]|nr:hypothetical protein [Blautia sp.]MCM1200035.1 hypothetical protein [Bacteroides fragilis]
MAVGEGSMERAAKAAGAKKAAPKKKTASVEKTPVEAVAAAEVIAAPSKEVLGQIVYQKSSGMLERNAEANEIFGLGDEMPVYYF